MGASASRHPELSTENPSSQFIEGLLLEQTPSLEGWIQAYGVLKNRSIRFYSSEDDYKAGAEPRSSISLANSAIHSFSAYQGEGVYPEGTIIVETPQGATVRRWGIQVFIAEERPAWLRAMRLASREPWRSDKENTACYLCDVPFDLMSRRHHCRRCGEVCCTTCASRSSALPDYDYHSDVRVCVGCYSASGPVMTAEERAARKKQAEEEAEELRKAARDADIARRKETGSAVEIRRERLRKMYGSFTTKKKDGEVA